MANMFRRLLDVLAGSTDRELRLQVQYLKLENEILRSKITGRVLVTPQEKARLIRFAKPLGSTIKALASIVTPGTLLRWIRADSGGLNKRIHSTRKPGRPRTSEDIRKLILRIASENGWGYTRILGELRKLNLKVSRGTVVNILKEAGMPTSQHRDEATWDEFIKFHAKTLWACDFIQQRILTWKGFKDAYLLVFINVATRQAVATRSTQHPDAAWVAEQVSHLHALTKNRSNKCRVMTRDRDTKFGKAFDAALRTKNIVPVRLPHRAPNLNAHVERFIQTAQNECLSKFIVMGTDHLDHLTSEFLKHYNEERPHSAINHKVPSNRPPPQQSTGISNEVHCHERLGGVLKHYQRQAA